MYEYKIVKLDATNSRNEETLNELGRQGWYLVSISDDTFGHVNAYLVHAK